MGPATITTDDSAVLVVRAIALSATRLADQSGGVAWKLDVLTGNFVLVVI